MSAHQTTAASTFLPEVPPSDVWAWHQHREAFERLVPPWQRVTLQRFPTPFEVGSEAVLEQRLGPAHLSWRSVLTEVHPGQGFVDEATSGPFASWRHEHRFEAGTQGEAGTTLVDTITWRPPWGPLGSLATPWLRGELGRLLDWRHRVTREDLLRHAPYRDRPRLRVAITGASGLVGSALTAFLRTGGHTVLPLVRRAPADGEIGWDPAAGRLDPADLEGVDAVVHLAGESIAGGSWTPERKRRIVDSRVAGTHLVASAIASCVDRPAVLVSASAVGWYGDRSGPVDETAGVGEGFLADTASAWERAADPARAAGVRVVHPRIGLVMSAGDGALATLLPMFRLGLGGPLGPGTQGFPWVALDDLVGILHAAIWDSALEGPVNAVAPTPVSQATFAHTLGRVLCRPASMPAPAFAIRALLGEFGQRMLLDGALVEPARLRAAGFTWYRDDLETALRIELGRPSH